MKNPFKIIGHGHAMAITHLPMIMFLLPFLLCLEVSAFGQTRVFQDTTILSGDYQAPAIKVLPVTSISPSAGQQVHLYIGSSMPGCPGFAVTFTSSQNYVVTTTPRMTGYNPANPFCSIIQSIQYLDGLGRPLQSVQVRGTADSSKDIIQPFTYDQFGREALKYLPYAAATANGSYRPDALTPGSGVYNYYKPANSGQDGTQQSNGVVVNTYPYSQTGFEPSPLNRMAEQGAPGAPWQLTTSGVSGAGHTMSMSYGTNTTGEVTLWTVNSNGNGATGSSSYDQGQLYKITTSDENANQTIEYKDKEGRVVCKKIQANGAATIFYSTNYIYNDLGQLAYVIPEIPAGVPSSFTESPADANFTGFIYGYHYDERSRLAEKKIPGKGWEYMVYDALDQVVATQDSVQKQNNWYTFNKYDGIGRVIMTGRITDSRSHQAITNAIATQTQNWETPVTTGDGYTTGNSFPTAWDQLYTVNYYDNYTFPGGNTYASTSNGISNATTGLMTGSKTNILGTTMMMLTEMYYDDKGRMLESIAQNHIGGYDRMVNTYNFNDQVTQSTRTHNSTTVSGLSIVTAYTYDHLGRKTTTTEKIGNGNWVALNRLDYNDIGQLKTKHLGNNIQQVVYAYNERGWMQGASAPLFTMQLAYNNGTTPQWNGNISRMNYTGPNSGNKIFDYTYDNLNRLTNAQSTNSTLDEQISYNSLGNITSLTRGGQSYGALTYAYENSNQSNRLSTVTGTGFNRNYAYDANGNAMSDGGSKSITYNYLNLPATVGNMATYTYSATGNKLNNTGTDGNWDYVNGIVYKNKLLSFIQTEEGRAIPGSGSYAYQYDLKDHLGDIRVSIDQGTNVLQEDEYYAFGLRKNVFDNQNGNRYLYNGKEIQADLTNQYDYGARFYDPVIARFTAVDPLATKYPWYTPYQFAGNEVPNAIDRDGLEPAYPRSDGSYALARDGQLQRPLLGTEAKQFDAHILNSVKPYSILPLINDFAQTLSTAGTVITAIGYSAAPFSEGSSLSLLPIGEGLSNSGAGLSAIVDAKNGDYKSAGLTIGAGLLFNAVGGKLNGLEKSGILTSTQKTLVGSLTTSASKLVDVAIDKSKKDIKNEVPKPEPVKPAPRDNTIPKSFEQPTLKQRN